MKKFILLFVLALMSFAGLKAQDSTYARNVIRALSSDRMYGRGASYHGDSIAAAYLASEMKRLGVLPLQVNYFQRYSYNCYSHEGPISLSVNGNSLEPFSQFLIFPAARFEKTIADAKNKKQLKDGTWLIGVEKLDTYVPIVGPQTNNPICIQVLDSLLPKRIKKVEANIPVHYRNNYWSQNVVGYVKGIVDTMIVFTAHYDHCGTMGDGVIFHGAHDNASGVAAVMDIARIASSKKPYYTMVFMLFSGEESGLLGSKYAADHPLIEYSKVKLLCNIDMFCGGDEGIMFFNAKSDNTKAFFNQMKTINDATKVAAEIRPRDNRPNSDHWWFTDKCPSIFLLTMGGPYGGYHDPADTCKGCGLAHYNDFLSLVLHLAHLEK